jgi:hypothetical protein
VRRPGPRLPRPRSKAARIGTAAGGGLLLWWILGGITADFLGTLLSIACGVLIIRWFFRRARRVRWREVAGFVILASLIDSLFDDWHRR